MTNRRHIPTSIARAMSGHKTVKLPKSAGIVLGQERTMVKYNWLAYLLSPAPAVGSGNTHALAISLQNRDELTCVL